MVLLTLGLRRGTGKKDVRLVILPTSHWPSGYIIGRWQKSMRRLILQLLIDQAGGGSKYSLQKCQEWKRQGND